MERAESTAFREAIRAEALRLGFERAGFTSADPLGPAHEIKWRRWREAGLAGTMQYLVRERPRRTHPCDLAPGARTVVVALAGYYQGDHGAPPEGGGAAGKIARYAWGGDYHFVLRDKLEALGEWIAAQAPGFGWSEPLAWRVCIDSAPLDERAFAVRAGLGFIGKNGLLIAPGVGSWILIGCLLISAPLPPDSPLRGREASCGSCRACIEACPVQAFDGPYRLDPRRCISYLTIEQKCEIPEDPAAHLDGWVFGCDRCQEVCPFNAEPLTARIEGLGAGRGAGPWMTREALDAIPSNNAFVRRWAATPLARAGRKGLQRSFRALAYFLNRE